MGSLKLIFTAFLCLLPQAFSFWDACAVGRPPIDVYTNACNQAGCTIARGEAIHMRITMDFLETHHNLRPRATVIILGVPIQIPDVPGHDDVCPHMTLNGQPHGCPVVPNVIYDWNINMIVPSTIPPFNNGRIRVEVLDGQRVVSCFYANGSIT